MTAPDGLGFQFTPMVYQYTKVKPLVSINRSRGGKPA
jgi:hypothetical protein